MDTALVVAVLPISSLDAVEKALQAMGICDLTVSTVRGYSRYADFLSRDHLVDLVKIEVLVAHDDARRIAGAIMDAGNAKEPGEGTIAIFPAEAAFNVRTCSAVRRPRA